MILAGDIGGTNARLALYDDDGKRVLRSETFESRAHRGLEPIVAAFLGRDRPKAAALGVAGPVVDDRCRATNLPWLIDGRALGRRLGIPKVALLNDLVAIATAAHALETMVQDVTDLASATEGELKFRPVTAVIRPELEVLAGLPLPLDAPREPEIVVEIAPEVPEFGQFDPILLRKCLTHLCAVVLNGLPPGSQPAIDLRCALAPGRRDRLRLTIAGHSPAPAAGQGQNPPSGETLALSLVYRVAEVMGARAAILRAPDGSPVARIELPFVTVPEPPATGAEAVYGRLRALVVDDIATNRFVLIQLLRALRIEADEAGGGGDALEKLAGGEFDLVLLDMNMPDMDGEATFREIRAAGAPWAEIPVVALTADAVALKRDYYLALGLNGFVSKPVDRRLLWAEILSAVPRPPPL